MKGIWQDLVAFAAMWGFLFVSGLWFMALA